MTLSYAILMSFCAQGAKRHPRITRERVIFGAENRKAIFDAQKITKMGDFLVKLHFRVPKTRKYSFKSLRRNGVKIREPRILTTPLRRRLLGPVGNSRNHTFRPKSVDLIKNRPYFGAIFGPKIASLAIFGTKSYAVRVSPVRHPLRHSFLTPKSPDLYSRSGDLGLAVPYPCPGRVTIYLRRDLGHGYRKGLPQEKSYGNPRAGLPGLCVREFVNRRFFTSWYPGPDP